VCVELCGKSFTRCREFTESTKVSSEFREFPKFPHDRHAKSSEFSSSTEGYANEDGIIHAVRYDPRKGSEKCRDTGMATDDACPRAMRYDARERGEPELRSVVARVLCYPARTVVAAARVSSPVPRS